MASFSATIGAVSVSFEDEDMSLENPRDREVFLDMLHEVYDLAVTPIEDEY